MLAELNIPEIPLHSEFRLLDGEGSNAADFLRVPRILIVYKECEFRAWISTELNKWGYEIHCASTERDALDMSKSVVLDLMFAETNVGNSSGFSLLQQMRKEQPHLPLVMISNLQDLGIAIDAMARGAYDYLLRPFELDHLLSTTQCAIDYRRALIEISREA